MVYVSLTLSGQMLAYKMNPVSRNLTFVESVFIDRGTSPYQYYASNGIFRFG